MWGALLLISPFFVLPPGFLWWGGEHSRSALLLTIAFLTLLAKLIRPSTGESSARGVRLPVFLGLLPAYFLASFWQWKHFPPETWTALVILLFALAVFLNPFHVKQVDFCLWLALMIQGGLVFWQMFGNDPLGLLAGVKSVAVDDTAVRAGQAAKTFNLWGSFGNAGQTAAWAALVFPVAVFSKTLKPWMRGAAFCASAFVLFQMQSLLGIAAAIAASVAWLFFSRHFGRVMLCGLLGLLCAGVLLHAWKTQDTGTSRFTAWKAATWHMQFFSAKDFLLGKGFGGFSELEIYQPGKRTEDRPIVWRHAHNEYLQTFVEQGLVGLSLLAGILVCLFRRSARLMDGGVSFASLCTLGILALAFFPFREMTLGVLSLSLVARVLQGEKDVQAQL